MKYIFFISFSFLYSFIRRWCFWDMLYRNREDKQTSLRLCLGMGEIYERIFLKPNMCFPFQRWEMFNSEAYGVGILNVYLLMRQKSGLRKQPKFNKSRVSSILTSFFPLLVGLPIFKLIKLGAEINLSFKSAQSLHDPDMCCKNVHQWLLAFVLSQNNK